MADVLEQPQTDAPEATPDFEVRLCATCSAAMAADQDWCLECGTAQPGRLGRRHGWRAALTVVGLTGVLATGAVAASYAALSSDAQRSASAPPPPAAQPTVTQPPAQTVPPETTPTVPAPNSDSGDDLPEAPAGGGDDLPSTPAPSSPAPAPSSAGTSGGSFGGGSSGGGSSEPVQTPLTVTRARNFDPDGRLTKANRGEPADAIDGERDTAWQAPVNGDTFEVNVGLVVSLGEARELDRAEITAGTPGFTMTTYGTKSRTVPQDLGDWVRIDSTRDFGDQESVDIDGSYRHVLFFFEEQPSDPQLFITEVELFD